MVTSYLADDDEDEGKNLIEYFLLNNNGITPMALALNVPLFMHALGIEPPAEIFRPVGIGSSVFYFSCWSDDRYDSCGLDKAQQTKVKGAVSYLLSLV